MWPLFIFFVAFSSAQSPYTWNTSALSQSRAWLASASNPSCTYLLFGGGMVGGTTFATVDILNAATHQWSQANLSVARSALTATGVRAPPQVLSGSRRRDSHAEIAVEEFVLFAGGLDANGDPSNVVDIFTVSSQSWTKASLSAGRGYLASTSVRHLALFAGGSGTNNVPFAAVDVFDASSSAWSVMNLSVARSNLAATSLDSLAFFAGGLIDPADPNGVQPSSVVDIYDAVHQSWSTAVLSVARSDLAAAATGTTVLFAGGLLSTGFYTNAVDVYDTVAGAWSVSQLSVARGYLVGATSGNWIIFAGGDIVYLDYFFFSTDVVDLYDAQSPTNSTPSWSTDTLSSSRENLAVAAGPDGSLYFGGGYFQVTEVGEYSSLVDIYTPANYLPPTEEPTVAPTEAPTPPTLAPTPPSDAPTSHTSVPTSPITRAPSLLPTSASPTLAPTVQPTAQPTHTRPPSATGVPTLAPVTPEPTETEAPTPPETLAPTPQPTHQPTALPTAPTPPTHVPTGKPTSMPTDSPIDVKPTPAPTDPGWATVGAVIGISFGGAFLLIVLVVAGWWCYRRRKRVQYQLLVND